jgi:mono/diheme cytochrome c family protein
MSLFGFVIALAMGCGNKDSSPPSKSKTSDRSTTTVVTPSVASPVDEAHTTFKNVCAACHGESGAGDGPAAAALNPKPRNYTDKAWQASVTDDHIKKTILEGGGAVGKSPAMPANPQLTDKPEVVDELVRMIRAFGT